VADATPTTNEAAEEERVDEIRAWFRQRGRPLLLQELPHEGWEALFPSGHRGGVRGAPAAFGETRRVAAEQAVAEYLATDYLSGEDVDRTPP
jgi:hypothetical protein